MISFDVFGEGKRFAFTMSFDDGSYDERLVGIFNKYSIKGTFHLNSKNMIKRGDYDTIKEVYKGHEVACHGCYHKSMAYIPAQSLVEEIFEDRKLLEAAVGYPVTGLSYANGSVTDEAISMLKSLGIVYSRVTTPQKNFKLPDDFMRWTPTCHYKEAIEDGKRFLASMDGYFGYPKLFYVWGHAHELERNSHWEMMEEFCAMIGGNDKIWYATNMEIYRHTKAQRELVIAADESFVYNPSAIDVWFTKDGEDFMVKGGETIRF